MYKNYCAVLPSLFHASSVNSGAWLTVRARLGSDPHRASVAPGLGGAGPGRSLGCEAVALPLSIPVSQHLSLSVSASPPGEGREDK